MNVLQLEIKDISTEKVVDPIMSKRKGVKKL